MSIVLKLQKKCLDTNEDLQNLLREALLISTKLNLIDFKNWVNLELNGYEDKLEVPKYRILNYTLSFFDPYQGWLVVTIPENWTELAEDKSCQPIGQLHSLVNSDDSGEITVHLAPHRVAILQKAYNTDFQPKLNIYKTQIVGIVEKVRTLLLEWTLKLKEDGILGNDDLIFTEKEKEAAKSIHIENFSGVMGDVEKIGNISTGDNSTNTYIENNIESKIDELIEEIKKLKLSDETALINEIKSSKNNFAKLKQILGGMLSRGAELITIYPLIGDILTKI